MNRSRIFWRSFLSILIPSELVVTLLSVLPWWFFIRGEETALHERQTHKVLLASGFVARNFASVISDLRVLSNDHSLQDWVDGGESTDLRKFQRNVLALHRDKSRV